MKTLDILRNSFGYEDFMNTYEDLNLGSKIASLPKRLRKHFLSQRNKIKNNFYEEYKKEYPNEVLRGFRELVYIYHIPEEEFDRLVKLFYKVTGIKKQEHLKKLMNE